MIEDRTDLALISADDLDGFCGCRVAGTFLLFCNRGCRVAGTFLLPGRKHTPPWL
ncbi:MAG: hypothetical protein ACOC9J_02280 [Persicimonas sp.]